MSKQKVFIKTVKVHVLEEKHVYKQSFYTNK